MNEFKANSQPLIDARKIAKYNSYSLDKLLEALPPALVILYPDISKPQALQYLIWGSGPEKNSTIEIERLSKYLLLSEPSQKIMDLLYGDGKSYALASSNDKRDRLGNILISYDQNMQFADSANDAAKEIGIVLGCQAGGDSQVALHGILENYLQAQREKSSVITIVDVVNMSPEGFARLAPDIDYDSRADYIAQKYYHLF